MAKPKILIVDPDEKNLRILAISLKKADLNVTVSTDGNDALTKLETLKPDLVISEIDLGSTDGFTLLKFIRETNALKDTPFIFLTKNKNIDDKVKGLKLGANDYLTKPIYLKEIITRVKLLLERVERDRVEIGADKGFSGDLSKMGVVELIQALELGNKTAIMRLKYKIHDGVIYFKKGRIVHAEVGKLKGEKAFYLILNWSEGTFEIEFTEHNVVETITISNQGLLMEGLRRIDEWKQLQEIIPPLDTVLVIDSQAILNEHPEQFPSKVENILAEFDGKKSILDVIESLELDEIEALKIVSQLYFQGFLVESSRPSDEKKVTYYYPARFAKNVEATPKESQKSWASEAEEFLTSTDSIGEDTTFLQPPVEEELEVKAPVSVPEPMAPQSEEVSAQQKPVEKVIYLKAVQEQKEKSGREGENLTHKAELTLKGPEPAKKVERQIVAISSRKEERKLNKMLLVGAGILAVALPVLIFSLPGLKHSITSLFSKSGTVLELSPEAEEHLAIAKSMFNTGTRESLASAEKEVRALLSKNSEHPEVLTIASLVYSNLGRMNSDAYMLGEGLKFAEKGLSRYPENTDLRLAKANALINLNRNDEAIEILEGMMKEGVEKPEIYYLYARGSKNIPEKRTQAIDAIYKFIKLKPQDTESRLELAYLLRESERYAEAEIVLKDPSLRSNLDALKMLAQIQERQGKVSEAVATYKGILSLDRDNLDARLKLAKASLDKEDYRTMDDLLSSVNIDSVPDKLSVEILYLLGRAREGMGRKVDALDYYRKVVARDENYMDAGSRLKRLESAQVAQVPRARETKQDTGAQYNAIMKKGKEYYKNGELEKAMEQFKNALKIKPQDDEALVELGTVLFDLGNDIDAILKLTQAVTINPNNSRGLLLLGNIYYARGEREKAINYYQRFLKIAPNSPYAQEVRSILGRLQ